MLDNTNPPFGSRLTPSSPLLPMLEITKPNLKILHPLPRVNEINIDVDNNIHVKSNDVICISFPLVSKNAEFDIIFFGISNKFRDLFFFFT